MHLSSHTWMRSEPLETTLERLSRLGYTSIELAGEPDQYSIEETWRLLKKHNIKCWGAVTIQHGKRNMISADPQQRRDTIEYNNRLAAGDGSFDWSKIMAALVEAEYDGGLAVEFMPPIDRTPIGKYGTEQLETGKLSATVDQLKFIVDHGSGLLSESYYTEMLRRSAKTLLPYVEKN